jgi:hypothetical protein
MTDWAEEPDIPCRCHDWLQRVGCRPSPVTKAAVQAEYGVSGSNQRDTGHWIWSAPPAAMADKQPPDGVSLKDRYGSIAD